jgi:hypothetical protein
MLEGGGQYQPRQLAVNGERFVTSSPMQTQWSRGQQPS